MSNFATERNTSPRLETDADRPAAPRPQPGGERAHWIGELARADGSTLTSLWSEWSAGDRRRSFEILRAPEIGLVMTRGRVGAEGAAFNLGEATVTRCSVRLRAEDGADPVDGHAYALGRDKTKALLSAKIDALMQTDAAPALDAAVIAPLKAARLAAKRDAARQAAATKVDFFTMVRGEG